MSDSQPEIASLKWPFAYSSFAFMNSASDSAKADKTNAKDRQKRIASLRLAVIPSVVEGSRAITRESFGGIPRLRFASLGITAKKFILGFQSTAAPRGGFLARSL